MLFYFIINFVFFSMLFTLSFIAYIEFHWLKLKRSNWKVVLNYHKSNYDYEYEYKSYNIMWFVNLYIVFWFSLFSCELNTQTFTFHLSKEQSKNHWLNHWNVYLLLNSCIRLIQCIPLHWMVDSNIFNIWNRMYGDGNGMESNEKENFVLFILLIIIINVIIVRMFHVQTLQPRLLFWVLYFKGFYIRTLSWSPLC